MIRSQTVHFALSWLLLSNKCDTYDETLPPVSKLEDYEESSSGFDWKAVLIGYGCEMVLRVAMGYLVFSKRKHKWVVRIVERGLHALE